MLRLFRNTLNYNTRGVFSSRAMCTAAETTVASETALPTNSEPIVIQTTKENIAQSPLKMRFLVMLVSGQFYS